MLFPATVRLPHPTRLREEVVVQVKVKKIKLDCGDYRLAEYPKGCVIERKASQFELFKNLEDLDDSRRQARAFKRLAESCEYPYLMIEASPTDLVGISPEIRHPQRVLAKLCGVIARYGFGVLWIPWGRTTGTRRRMGTVMVHLMLACGLKNSSNPIDNPPDLL